MNATLAMINSFIGLAASAAEPVKGSRDTRIDRLRDLISVHYGFWMRDDWLSRLEDRAQRRTTATGRRNLSDYLAMIEGGDRTELQNLMELLLNHETHFARTQPHFEALISEVIPAWRAQRRGNRLRIASLGCSTGEEVYSIAMVLAENLRRDEWEAVELSGLDVSAQALAQAREGSYGEFQLRDLDATRRARWFTQNRGRWVVKPALREAVRLFQHNLLNPLPCAGLDVIFCRNVIIYFLRPVVDRLMGEFHAALNPRGHLVLGHSESALNYPNLFRPVRVAGTVIYQRTVSSAAVPTDPNNLLT